VHWEAEGRQRQAAVSVKKLGCALCPPSVKIIIDERA
jgi:hypothetical protein